MTNKYHITIFTISLTALVTSISIFFGYGYGYKMGEEENDLRWKYSYERLHQERDEFHKCEDDLSDLKTIHDKELQDTKLEYGAACYDVIKDAYACQGTCLFKADAHKHAYVICKDVTEFGDDYVPGNY